MQYRWITFYAASAILALPLAAQEKAADASRVSGSQRIELVGTRRDSVVALLSALARDPYGGRAASPENVTAGARLIAPTERILHDVVTYRGDLEVRGTIVGDAIALQGNVILASGSNVSGDVISVGGSVRKSGGVVGGEIRELSRIATPGGFASTPAATPVQATRRALALVGASLLILATLAAGVFVFARSNLETVADTIRDDFGRSLLIGIGAQVAFLPALIVLIVGLAITLIGILLIPFAVVAYFTAAAGALALAFIAFAYVAGDSILHRLHGNARNSPGLAILLAGLFFFFLLWLVAALFTWAGALSPALNAVAALVTWLAVSVGFGATVISRGGTRAISPPTTQIPVLDEYTWQTPTPVAGVVAARRPTPLSRERIP
ncbi:MAG: hypothetical protein H7Z74_16590 [Anaerolineae bacterium]|nr:hypothetical protein [Gemmatimonadaceae bacterium]